eukprot:PhF_6_TR11712/c1_g1_i1/m.19066
MAESTEDKEVKVNCTFKPQISKFAKELPQGEAEVVVRLTTSPKPIHPSSAQTTQCTFVPKVLGRQAVGLRNDERPFADRLSQRQPSPPKIGEPNECNFKPRINANAAKPRGEGVFKALYPTKKKEALANPEMPEETLLPLNAYSSKENTVNGEEDGDVSIVDVGSPRNDYYVDVPSEVTGEYELDGYPTPSHYRGESHRHSGTVAKALPSVRATTPRRVLNLTEDKVSEVNPDDMVPPLATLSEPLPEEKREPILFTNSIEMALAVCSGKAHLEDVEHSLQNCANLADFVAAKHKNSYTALHIAARYNRGDVCKLLMESGASIHQDSVAPIGGIPLHVAARLGNVESLTALLKPKGMRRDGYTTYIDTQLNKKYNPLTLLTHSGCINGFESFISIVPKDITISFIPFLVFLSWEDRIKDVATWMKDWTPVNGDPDYVVDELGVNIQVSKFLCEADYHCYRAVRKFNLKEQGLNLAKPLWYPPPKTVSTLPFVKYIILSGNQCQDFLGMTILHHAAALADTQLIEFIFDHDPKTWMNQARDLAGRTAIHHAILNHDCANVVERLITARPEFVMLMDDADRCPFDLAYAFSRYNTLEYLRSSCHSCNLMVLPSKDAVALPVEVHSSWTPAHQIAFQLATLNGDEKDSESYVEAIKSADPKDFNVRDASARTPKEVCEEHHVSKKWVSLFSDRTTSTGKVWGLFALLLIPYFSIVFPINTLAILKSEHGYFRACFRPIFKKTLFLLLSAVIFVLLVCLECSSTSESRIAGSLIYVMSLTFVLLGCGGTVVSAVAFSNGEPSDSFTFFKWVFLVIRLVQSCASVSLMQMYTSKGSMFTYDVFRYVLAVGPDISQSSLDAIGLIFILPSAMVMGAISLRFCGVCHGYLPYSRTPWNTYFVIYLGIILLMCPVTVAILCFAPNVNGAVGFFFPSFVFGVHVITPFALHMGSKQMNHFPVFPVTLTLARDNTIIFLIHACAGHVTSILIVVGVYLILYFVVLGGVYHVQRAVRGQRNMTFWTWMGVEGSMMIMFFIANVVVCNGHDSLGGVLVATVGAITLAIGVVCLRKYSQRSDDDEPPPSTAFPTLPGRTATVSTTAGSAKKSRNEKAEGSPKT